MNIVTGTDFINKGSKSYGFMNVNSGKNIFMTENSFAADGGFFRAGNNIELSKNSEISGDFSGFLAGNEINISENMKIHSSRVLLDAAKSVNFFGSSSSLKGEVLFMAPKVNISTAVINEGKVYFCDRSEINGLENMQGDVSVLSFDDFEKKFFELIPDAPKNIVSDKYKLVESVSETDSIAQEETIDDHDNIDNNDDYSLISSISSYLGSFFH